MHICMKSLDWNLIRAFHATAEAGSLSAAARQIGLTQPTMSRQVAALEAELEVTLFQRVGRRLILTDIGRTLLKLTESMSDAAAAVSLAVKGQEQEIKGRVSVSASDSFSQYLLPELIEQVRAQAPQIAISVIVTNEVSDLHRGEADIAIRHAEPDRDGLVGHYIRDSEAFFYASEAWVERHGLPQSYPDLAPEELIGFNDLGLYTVYLRQLGFSVEPDDFRVASKSSVVIWEMVKRGMGVAPILREVADRTPGMVRLFPDASPIRSPIWIVIHEHLQASPKIRLVRRILEEGLTEMGRAVEQL